MTKIKAFIVDYGVIGPFVCLVIGFFNVNSYPILSSFLFLVAIIMFAVIVYDNEKSEIDFRKYEQVLEWLNGNEITKTELEAICKNYPVVSNAEFRSIKIKTEDNFTKRCVAESNDMVDEIKHQLVSKNTKEINQNNNEK